MSLQKRNYGLDLLRIISMCMIVFMHMQTHGGGKEIWNQSLAIRIPMLFLTILSICSVNIFVMISGYFMCEQTFRVSRVIKIIGQVVFYSWILCLIMVKLGVVSLFSEEMIRSIFPIAYRKYWFATTYVGLLLISPILNIAIKSMSKRQHKACIVILLVMSCLWSDIIPKGTAFNIESGYSLVWFAVLYIIAAYVRKHVDVSKINRGKCVITYFIVSIIILLITIGLGVLIGKLNFLNGILTETYYYRYNSLFVVIESVALFLFFLTITLKSTIAIKLICFFAPLTFGVYLISDNDPFREVMWEKVNLIVHFTNSPLLIVQTIVTCILIFFVCALLDKVRLILFNAVEKISLYTYMIKKADDFSSGPFK